jgi:hypothetical protein
MRFEKLKFKPVDDCPWLEAAMDRVIFKDCAVSIALEPDGLFMDYEEEQDDHIEVTAYVEVAGKMTDCHKTAFDHFIQNAAAYEERILRYLFAISSRNAGAAVEADDSRKLQAFIKKHSLHEMAGLKKQIDWIGLGLFDHGLDGVGFITLDFRCGWDPEHGVSILMHRDKVIAEGGLAEWSNRGDSLIESAKYTQGYTDGYDIKLP